MALHSGFRGPQGAVSLDRFPGRERKPGCIAAGRDCAARSVTAGADTFVTRSLDRAAVFVGAGLAGRSCNRRLGIGWLSRLWLDRRARPDGPHRQLPGLFPGEDLAGAALATARRGAVT